MSTKSRKPARGPRALGQLLKRAGGAMGSGDRRDLAALRIIWPPLVGRTLAEGTQIAEVRGRTLHVRASHAELARELEFLKEHVIRGLEEHAPDARIRSVRIRVEPLMNVEEAPQEERHRRTPDAVDPDRVAQAESLASSIEDEERQPDQFLP